MTENSVYKTALLKSMNLCSGREYCINDIRNKLISWGVSESDSEKLINTLIRENFINEDRYASAFVRDKFNYNKWGKVKITAYLRARQIPSEVISGALETIDDEIYLSTLRELINSHRRHIKAKNLPDLRGKLLRYGLSKGFESSLLYDILNKYE